MEKTEKELEKLKISFLTIEQMVELHVAEVIHKQAKEEEKANNEEEALAKMTEQTIRKQLEVKLQEQEKDPLPTWKGKENLKDTSTHAFRNNRKNS